MYIWQYSHGVSCIMVMLDVRCDWYSHPSSCRPRCRLCSGRRRCWRWRRISLFCPDNWIDWGSREGGKLPDRSWSCLVFLLNWKHQEKSRPFNSLFLPVSERGREVSVSLGHILCLYVNILTYSLTSPNNTDWIQLYHFTISPVSAYAQCSPISPTKT